METRGRKVARFCKGAKEPTAGGSFGWCQSIFKPVFKSFNMASDIVKLQFTTVASYEKIFCDANLIIPGKESVKEENIHVYLAPLIEELQRLWKGVKATDGSILEKVHASVEGIHFT